MFINKQFLKAIWDITLSFTVINSKWGIDTHLITLFLICSIRHKLKYNFFRKFLSQFDLKGTNSWCGTIKRPIHVILRIKMFKHNSITEGYVFTSFLWYYGLELLFLCFRSRSCLFLFCRILYSVHLIIDLKWGSW